MAQDRERVFVERESEKGKRLNWHAAWLRLDQMTGVIALQSMGVAKKWAVTFQVAQLEAFEILRVSDVRTLTAMYGGGLAGWAMAAIMSRWAKVPVIKLSQQSAEAGGRWAHIRMPGMRPKKTRDLANRIADLLRQHGYSGMMPNLADEELWKAPTGPILIGCGLLIVIVVCLVAVITVIGTSGS